MREIWIVKGEVTDVEAHGGNAVLGQTEWQFSDGPANKRGSSDDYLSLEKGLAENSGAIFHFEGE